MEVGSWNQVARPDRAAKVLANRRRETPPPAARL
jgi:hypothetical protein